MRRGEESEWSYEEWRKTERQGKGKWEKVRQTKDRKEKIE